MKVINISIKLFFAGGLGLLFLKLIYAFALGFAEASGLHKETTFIVVSAIIAVFLIAISFIYKAPTLSNLIAENAILSEKIDDLASENDDLESDLADCQKQNALWAIEFQKANNYAKEKHNEVLSLEKQNETNGKQTKSNLELARLELAAARENARAANAKISDFTKEKSELMQTISKLQASSDFVNLLKSKYSFVLELEKANTIEDKEAALENLKSFGRSLINSINGAKKGKKSKEYETV